MASSDWKEHLDKHHQKMKDVEHKYERKANEHKARFP